MKNKKMSHRAALTLAKKLQIQVASLGAQVNDAQRERISIHAALIRERQDWQKERENAESVMEARRFHECDSLARAVLMTGGHPDFQPLGRIDLDGMLAARPAADLCGPQLKALALIELGRMAGKRE